MPHTGGNSADFAQLGRAAISCASPRPDGQVCGAFLGMKVGPFVVVMRKGLEIGVSRVHWITCYRCGSKTVTIDGHVPADCAECSAV